jgi:hypothetical protein
VVTLTFVRPSGEPLLIISVKDAADVLAVLKDPATRDKLGQAMRETKEEEWQR